MASSITDQAASALRDLVGLIPADQRRWAEDDIGTLERALSLLGQALSFQQAVTGHAEQFSRSVHVANLAGYERGMDRVS